MKKISSEQIIDALQKAVIRANVSLDANIIAMLRNAIKKEENELALKILNILLENAEISLSRNTPLCQDTGVAVLFVTIGSNVSIKGMPLEKAINEGIKEGYEKGFLRKSIVSSPIKRINTNTNTPTIIHYNYTEGEEFIIDLLIKGGGCENKSALKMLKPSDGINGINDFVIDTVKCAGAAACPPFFIGIGLGGNFEKCALLAKKALLRDVGAFNSKEYLKSMEVELLSKINKLSIGPMGVSGKTTAFSVAIEEAPCHIASLPVAVNIDCHSHRHRRIVF
ncbi:MAG: fumarate hydratase [Candidatus Aureabacteria bacterium]|nr:fumarate hydratase [Candidatus Auribacterota bacterium]